ncbi:MAG: FAD-binding oxidoreductase, partial [Alphaproteobacteria bacterium]
MTDMDALAGRLSDRLGPRGIIREPALLERYLSEQRGRYESVAPFVARPATADEVAETVFICAEARCAVIPQGGNTGLVGGAVVTRDRPGILLSLERLRHVREIDTVGDTMTVEAGCILADIQEAAREHDRLFPLSLGAEGSCQIGGNLSTNAGGTNVLRYGNARDLVLGLE